MIGASHANGRGSELVLSHVADHYRPYPGETVNFLTRVHIREPVATLALRIDLPHDLALETYRALESGATLSVRLESGEDRQMLVWERVDVAANSVFHYETVAKVLPNQQQRNRYTRCVAVLTMSQQAAAAATISQVAELFVAARGRYLKHLPAVYEQDELMGRFLMLFESFWEPISRQIDTLSYYFDPQMTPSDFLPWLAGWLNFTLDPRWSDDIRRAFLGSAIQLYRQRGTKAGLARYLRLVTGSEAEITERRSNDFRLGPQARLGPGVAFGTGNTPHTFDVSLTVPAVLADELEAWEQIIRSIIINEKPAHTAFTLTIKPTIEGEQE